MELNSDITIVFWRRIVSIIIDIIVLGIIGTILGLFLFDFFVSLEQKGPIVGFFVTSLYFSIMNSNKCNGQTIGKKLLQIEVVDEFGHYLSITQSFLRQLILILPYYSFYIFQAYQDQIPPGMPMRLYNAFFGFVTVGLSI